MPIKNVISSGRRPIKIWTDEVEGTALKQLQNLADMPFIHKHVACMPDVHAGKGSTIGSVIATDSAIIPAAVGVDIGCGMNAVQLSLTASDLPDNLYKIRRDIEKRVPLSSTEGHAGAVPMLVQSAALKMSMGLDNILFKAPLLRDRMPVTIGNPRWVKQLGTLGSGNHFIEICLDEGQNVWVMLHSGSRGIGNMIGTHYIAEAKREMEKWKINLPDKDLSYLPTNTKMFDDYMYAMNWAQNYALINRQLMMKLVLRALGEDLPPFAITNEGANCHHNYVSLENHYGKNVYVTRKGAVRAREGDIGIIPGSMGTKSFIVKGLGNKESFCSCSHGAGRKMSRTKAKATFNSEDLRAQTEGVECRKDKDVVDEIPSAYKDIDQVMANQEDLVEVLHTLKQVVCVKG